jgi:hypothetical protein
VIALLHDDGALKLGATKNLVIGVWRETPTVDQLRMVEDASRAIAKQRNEAIAYINAILEGSGRFPPEVRAEVARLARDTTLPRVGVAHLILLSGWQGPAARAFVRAAIAIARAPAPNRVFRDIRACADWMSKRLGGAWTAHEVERAYTQSL